MKSRGLAKAAVPRRVVACQLALLFTVGLLALGPGAASAQGAVELSGPFTIDPEPRVHHQLLADFTGDSDPDLVTITSPGAFSSQSKLEFRRGLGGHGFGAPTVIDDANLPLSDGGIASADLNGDGNRDLVVAGGNPELKAYAGNGAGGFSGPVGRDLPGDFTSAVAIGHFDADDDPDVVVAQRGSNLLVTAFGHTGVSFQLPDERPTSDYYVDTVFFAAPKALAVLDTNNDGRDDVVALGSNGQVRTFRQHNPDCTDISCKPFTNGNASTDESGFPGGNHIATGDFNGDGRGDVAVAGGDGAPGGDTGVAVLAQNPGGGFAAPVIYDVPLEINNAQIGIANQDLGTDPELIVTTGRGAWDPDTHADVGVNQVAVLTGAAGATFGPPEMFDVGARVGKVTVAQINGAGRLDFVVGGHGLHGFLNGPGELPPDTVITRGPSGRTNDAAPSFRFESRGLPQATSFECRVDDGEWEPCSSPFATGELSEGEHGFDVRGIAPGGNVEPEPARRDFTVEVHEPAPAPVFAATPNFINAGGGDESIASADFNEDGMPDIAVPDSDGSTVQVLFGDGVTFAGPPLVLDTGQGPVAVVAGRLDEDEHDDLATANFFDGTVSLMLGNGDGTFKPTKTLNVADDPRDIVAADLGQAGMNLLTVHSNAQLIDRIRYSGEHNDNAGEYELGFSPSSVTVTDLGGGPVNEMIVGGPGIVEIHWADDGTNLLSNRAQVSLPGTPTDMVTGDFDGDGNVDVAATMSASDQILVLLGDGARGFTFGAYTHPVGDNPRALTAADFNGDGIDDLVVANRGSDDFSILLGRGAGGFAPGVSFSTLLSGGTSGNGPTGIAAVDTNLDGRIDVVTANDSDVTRVRNDTVPPDTTAPKVTLKGKRKQRVARVAVRIRASEPCTAAVRSVALLKRKGRKGKRKVKLPAQTMQVAAGKARKLKVKPGRKVKRFVKRGKGKASLRVTVRCTDSAQNASGAARLNIKLR